MNQKKQHSQHFGCGLGVQWGRYKECMRQSDKYFPGANSEFRFSENNKTLTWKVFLWLFWGNLKHCITRQRKNQACEKAHKKIQLCLWWSCHHNFSGNVKYFDPRIYLPKLQGTTREKGLINLLLVILHSELLGCAVASAVRLHRLLVPPGDALHSAWGCRDWTAGHFGLSRGRIQHKRQLSCSYFRHEHFVRQPEVV